ncbi:MAG TPA: gluconokinase [Pseudolysinimonas sp.]|jgi:gluconokinase
MPFSRPVVVMGVSGSGKSTVGAAVADALGLTFVDGDSLHPASNVAKMAAGIPLDDADRAPWLDAIAARLSSDPVVIACSALKRAYRDRLRASAPDLVLVFLEADRATLLTRMTHRPGHFMPASLLDSQLATLEPPAPDEHALTVDASAPIGALLASLEERMSHE